MMNKLDDAFRFQQQALGLLSRRQGSPGIEYCECRYARLSGEILIFLSNLKMR